MSLMTRETLEQILRREGVRQDAYSLEGGLPDERYCLDHSSQETWTVYYSERGLRTGERRFESEADACEYLLDLILRDPTTRS
jgi:hypothetical protein